MTSDDRSLPRRWAVGRLMGGPRPAWAEAIAVFVLYQVFERARGLLPQPVGPAFGHAAQVVRAERFLGVFVEGAVQRWFLPWHPVVEAFDVYYGTAHFVVPAIALLLLWRRDRARYRRCRNAFGFMLAVSLAAFAFWPLAPPRLLPPPHHFVDTAATIGGMGALDRGNLKDDNEVAAMPSLHIGWSSWSVVALLPALRRRWAKALLVAYPVVTLLVVMATANHYLVDGVGGLAVMAAGFALEAGRERWWSRRAPPGHAPTGAGVPSRHPLDVEVEHLGVAGIDGGLDP
ncbi:MAG: phosphatase PAP2 family protein [Acidimicrobiales bacterium]